MKRRTAVSALAAVALLACGPSLTGPEGDPVLEVIEGNGQTITAGTDRTDRVRGRLTLAPDGSLALYLGPRPLHAQTTVGTPVPDALVCSAPVDPETGTRILETDPRALIPFVPCVTTDENGDAVFYYEGARRAGLVNAEVRTQERGLPEVVARVTMNVEPGPVALNRFALCDLNVEGNSPIEVPPTMLEDEYENRVPFTVESGDTAVVRADSLTLTAAGAGVAPLVILRDGVEVAQASAIVDDGGWIELRGTGCQN